MSQATITTEAEITTSDFRRSRTVRAMEDVDHALAAVRSTGQVEVILDIGCGFGGLTAVLGRKLGAQKLYGVDIDEAVLPEAAAKGVDVQRLDIGKERLPFPDQSVDLVTCFGMLDYLEYFDMAIEEMNRVLRVGGQIIVTLPNLAAWNNRLALLRGYQIRDVEVSERAVVGAHPHYRKSGLLQPSGHIHTVTARGFEELMRYHGFVTTQLRGSAPDFYGPGRVKTLVKMMDRWICRWPNLARRFVYVGRKPLLEST